MKNLEIYGQRVVKAAPAAEMGDGRWEILAIVSETPSQTIKPGHVWMAGATGGLNK